MLKLRLLTAIILIPVFATLVLTLSPKGFCIFTGMLVILCAWEWSNLMGVKGFPQRIFYPLLMFALLVSALYLIYVRYLSVPQVLYSAFIWWLIAGVLVITYPKSKKVLGKGFIIRSLMGIMVLMPCWIALNFIHSIPDNGPYILLYLFVLIWGADSGAYFVGKKWGKNKLLPLVSPGKTWQGLFGALITSAIIVLLGSLWFKLPYSGWGSLLLLSLVTVLFSVLGDLFESMLKRHEGIKDSGNILPGHGGILDRIDSLTAAAPIFALSAIWLQ